MDNNFYCILPAGNRDEFSEIDRELKSREVKCGYWQLSTGSRIYSIPETELNKLPHDDKGPYLGTNFSGHSIYKIDDLHNNSIWSSKQWFDIK